MSLRGWRILGRKIEISWQDFGVAITVELMDEESPDICQELWRILPFQTFFVASMSAGEMYKIPLPVTLHSAPEKQVPFNQEPPGTLFYSGMPQLYLSYGTVVSPIPVSRVGRVSPEELATLRKNVVAKLSEAYFFTKQVNIATLLRKE